VAVITLAVGVHEEDVVGKKDGAVCNRDVGVPEKVVENKERVITEATEGLWKTWLENKLAR